MQSVTLPGTGAKVGVDVVGDVDVEVVKIDIGGTGVSVPLTAGQKTSANSVPVVLSSDQYAALVAVLNALAPLTSVAVSGTVGVNNFPATQPVSAASLPLPSGAATAAKQPALGSAGSASSDVLTAQGIAGMTPFKTDGSATTQPISAATLPLPADASKETGGNLDTIATNTGRIPALGQAATGSSVPVVLPATQITALAPPAAITNYAEESGGNLATIATNTQHIPPLGQAVAASSSPVVLPTSQITTLTPPAAITNYANETGGNLATIATNTTGLLTTSDFDTKAGSLTETAPASDTASSGLNGRLQRIAQRVSSLIALLPTSLGAGGGLKVDGSGTALPVSGTVTANAGTNLNTSTLALETGGNLATLAGVVSGSKAAVKSADGDMVTFGAKADAKSTATDTTAITVMQVLKQISFMAQNPASTPVTGTFWQSTQPVSAAALPLPSGASTAAKQPALGTAGTPSTDVQSMQGVAGGTPLPVGGTTVTISTSLTRTANTTAYSANQVIGAATSGGANYETFANAARVSAGSGVIVGVNLVDEVNATTPLQPILFLFNAAPTNSTINDGAALAIANADAITCIGVIPLVTSYLVNASSSPSGARVYTAQGLNIAFKLASGSSLFGVLIANAAYTPVSAEVLVTQLQILQD